MWEDDGFLDQYLDDSLISSEYEDETPDPKNPLKMIPGHRQHVLQFLAIRTSNGHLAAPLRCTLSSSCHRIALATAPGVPTPQHHFPDSQKLAAGFQLAFSRTGPKTVSCSPLPVVRFGGEHNVLSLHTHHRSSQDCTCRPAVAITISLPNDQLEVEGFFFIS